MAAKSVSLMYGSACNDPEVFMHRQAHPLHNGWTLTCMGGPGARPGLPEAISATVPGTVHTDLLKAGLIPDPYLDLNEISVDWVGRCDWRYETRFDWPFIKDLCIFVDRLAADATISDMRLRYCRATATALPLKVLPD